MTTTLTAARRYLESGWWPIPLPAGAKHPPPTGVTGWNGRATTIADLTRPGWDWTGNIAIRLPPDVIGIDVDAYHGGGASLDELEATHGKLPATTWSTSRDDGSGIALYRIPVGTVLATDPAQGIDIIQSCHRYMVVAPSTHPDTGKRYRWIDEQADEEVDAPPEPFELPELPWPWIQRLATVKDAAGAAATPDAAREFIDAHTTTTRIAALKGITTRLADVQPGGRHDALVSAACWAMREAAAGLYSANAAVNTLHAWWTTAVADDPHRRDGGEFGAAILWAIGQAGTDPERVERIADRSSTTTNTVTMRERPDHIDENGEIHNRTTGRLNDEFWQTRPALAHIAAAADAAVVSREAVLIAVLGNVATHIPQAVLLPGPPAPKPLNLMIGIAGPPGASKGGAFAVADHTLPAATNAERWPVGTGQGFVKSFFATDDKNKLERHSRPVILATDEIGAYVAETGRNGETLSEQLKMAWSGEDLGYGYAGEGKRLKVEQHTYRSVVRFGVAPGVAAGLFRDLAGGLPQRITFALATVNPDLIPDDNQPTRPDPGRLPWSPPNVVESRSARGCLFTYHPDVDEERRRLQRSQQRHPELVDHLDVHATQMRLKIAATIAALDGRWNINPDDWTLSGDIMDAHRAARRYVLDEIRRAAADDRAAKNRHHAERVEAGTEAEERTRERLHTERVIEVARQLVGYVKDHGTQTGNDLRKRLGKTKRDVLVEALEHAHEARWLHIEEVTYQGQPGHRASLGEKRP